MKFNAPGHVNFKAPANWHDRRNGIHKRLRGLNGPSAAKLEKRALAAPEYRPAAHVAPARNPSS